MFRIFPELVRALSAVLPPWAIVPVVAAGLLALVPTWFHWVRTRQIRRALQLAFRSSDAATRDGHVARAFAIASGRPRRLVALADEAVRLGLKRAWTQALAALEATNAHPADLKRLRQQTREEPTRGRHPLEEAVVIERMLDQGLHAAARERLAESLARFPDDPELLALRERLQQAS